MRRHAPLLLLALLPLAACSDGGSSAAPSAAPSRSAPPETAFADGTCRLAAPDVLAVARDADRLGDGPTVEAEVTEALREEQDRLFALAETADAAVRPALDRLVVAIGLVRVRADGNTYEPSLGADLVTAYDAVVRTCTAPPSAG